MMARILAHQRDLGNGVGLHYSGFHRFSAVPAPSNQLLASIPPRKNRYYYQPIREDGLKVPQGSTVPDRSRPVPVAVVPRRELTPRTAAWTVLRRAEKRSAQDREMLAELRQDNPELDEAIALAEEFAALVRGRQPERLDPWLQRAQDGTIVSLRRFAKRLSADYDAVRAAVTLGWSNGPVEGQINRLKMLKRTMYGRAGLDLIGRRFLLAA